MKIRNIFISLLAGCFILSSCSKPDEQTVINTNKPAVNPGNGNEEKPNITPSTLKIGTYNLWVINNGNKYENYKWSVRKARLAQSIANNSFDIFGFQECDGTIKNELPAAVRAKKDIYEWHFNKDSHLGFAYNKERLEVTEPIVFWLSDTPDQKSNCWDGYSGRLCLYTVVTDKLTKKQFGFMATHGPLYEDHYRVKMANLLNARAAMYGKEEMPIFLVGDLNTEPTEPGYTELCTYWKDCYKEISYKFKYGPIGSFNSHSTSTNLADQSRRIDYIMVRDPKNQVELVTYRNDNSTYDGFFPSDHCPVSVQLNLN